MWLCRWTIYLSSPPPNLPKAAADGVGRADENDDSRVPALYSVRAEVCGGSYHEVGVDQVKQSKASSSVTCQWS